MNPTELHRLSEWPFQDILFSVAGSADGKRAWVGSSDARVYELDLSSKKPAETRVALEGDGHSSYVTGMARTESTLITCSYDRKLI